MDKQVRMVRPAVRDGIEMIVGTDRVTVKVDSTVDDSEIKALMEFARMVAAKCGKSQVILTGKIERQIDGGFTTALKPLRA